MRILQFVPYFIPYPGGQERYVYCLSKYLVKNGHEVWVITSNFPKSRRLEVVDGIVVERYAILARPLRNPIAPGFLSAVRKFKEFDVVHVHNEHSFPSLIAAYAKRRDGFPLVLTNHGRLVFGDPLRDSIERIYMKYLGKLIFESCDAIVVNSEADRELVREVAPRAYGRSYVIHNAVDPELLEATAREVKAVKEGEFKILYVGALIRRKGLEWLIKAMDLVRREVRGVKCIIVGEGGDEGLFKRLTVKYGLTEVVRFAGRVSDKELIRLYKSSDLFVLPSLSEGCPTSVLEAMYFGLPVVLTSIPAHIEHFRNVALLVKPKDERSLALGMIELLSNENLRRKLSKEGSELVRKEYTWDKVAKKYMEVYERVINSTK